MLKTNAENLVIVPKGWGWEKIIVNKEEYCGKILHFYAGKRLSYHFHKLKDETFFLNSGKVIIKFSNGDDLNLAEECELNPGDSFYVPVGLRHQIIALEESDIFEFSTTHRDSDSYRIVPGDQL